jgi:hypothetical protein
VPSRGGPGFTELSPATTGIDFSEDVPEDSVLENRHLAMGSGVALGDVDGDGRVDIFLARVGGPSAIYRNLGGWRFENIARKAGVELIGRPSFGATLVDVDGDGDLDLLVTGLGGPNTLMLNDGHGHFTEVTEAAGLTSHRGSTTATLADVDGNGTLDLYIANYKAKDAMDIFPPQERTFDQVVHRVGDHFEVTPRFREHYRVEMRPDLGAVVRIQRGEPDWFYLNDGHGRFTPVPMDSGRFLDEDGKPLTSVPDRFGLTARFYDVNGDGFPDLYVCNDFEDPDQLWINDGTGHFRAAPRLALRSSSNSSMAVDFSDIDRDGNVDFFVVDMWSRDSRRRKRQSLTYTPLPKRIGAIDDRPQVQRNTLFLSRGDGTFAQIAAAAGVDASEWSWSTLFMDVDLDGYEDILVGTGHLWDVMDADTWERIRTSVTGASWHKEFLLFPKLPLRNEILRNNGDLTFTEVGAKWGFAPREDITHGMATADLDGDGDLDVVINRFGAAAGVFRNDASTGRVAVRLRGRSPNTKAVGAKIRLLGGPVRVQQKEVTVGGLYLSSSDPLYAFASRPTDTLTIEIIWRDGQRTTIRVRANREYEIFESSKAAGAAPPRAASAPLSLSSSPPPLFTDVSQMLGHTHVETAYDDFVRQALLPNKLSQLGPGISWYDCDGDGHEDLLISSGQGGSLAFYRNDGHRFRRTTVPGGEAKLDQTTILAVPGANGGTDLLVGQASYESATPEDALAAASVIRLPAPLAGTRRRGTAGDYVVVAGDTASVGPLAAADYDGNGNLDLFVGGRVLPGGYPLQVSSRLYLRRGNKFILDTANQAVLRDVGMISAALFTDIDGDGDPDLLLAPEWGPIRLFINNGGRFTDATKAYGLSKYSSRWSGIATGDVDGDGRLDIVATTWGRNTKYRVDKRHPVFLYYGNFDSDGILDLLEAQPDDQVGGISPLETLSRLTVALPFTRNRVRTFASYSTATIEDLLGPSLGRARRLEANTFDHALFLNRGGSFEASALPAVAQLAPASYAGVADFDGDGREDIFLSQNFFPTEVSTPRYDAGVGLLLKGDGRGGFLPLSSKASGIAVFGDQRGAAFADFDNDGRLDLAVSQNGAATKLYRNTAGRIGLRVRLIGAAGNPRAIGALIRIRYADDTLGPAREVQAGSGYWSQNGAVQVLGRASNPTALWLRWPGGREQLVPLAAGQAEITVRMP